MNLSVEHVLMIVLVAFALHYLMGNCGCIEGVGEEVRLEGAAARTNVRPGGGFHLGHCCDMGSCKEGLECNRTAEGFDETCLADSMIDLPFFNWWGRCEHPTHWFADAGGAVADAGGAVAHKFAPMNKEEDSCCHYGDCKVGLECDSSGSSLLGGTCDIGWSGICKRPGRISPPSGAGPGGR